MGDAVKPMMKRMLSILLAVLLLLPAAGCGAAPQQSDDETITIVTTIFPEYDWLRQLTAGSEGVTVKLLIDTGVDLHSYQPSVSDIVDIATCDVFIYSGGASDSWVKDALETANNPNMTVIDLTEVLEGYRPLCETEVHAHDHGEADHDHTADEHIWLSLVNAQYLCAHLGAWLQVADPHNAALYAANTEAYLTALSAADEAYRTAVEEATHDCLIFADRFPFAYLAEDYGLHVHAAFEGCSADSEVSFVTVAELAADLAEEDLPGVVVIDDSDHRLAETVLVAAGDASRTVFRLQSMQAVGRVALGRGVTYLQIMDENLAVLRQALN